MSEPFTTAPSTADIVERLRGHAAQPFASPTARRVMEEAADRLERYATPGNASLAGRVRTIADRFVRMSREGSSMRDDVATLRTVADEVERLTRLLAERDRVPLRSVLPGVPWSEVGELARDFVDRDRDAMTMLDAMRAEGWRVVMADVASPDYELRGDGGVPPAEAEYPNFRRFAVRWRERDGEPPTPGSFVLVPHGQPSGAAAFPPYRVHAFDRLEVGGWLAVVEPVDAHDVPVFAKVRAVPHPIADVTALAVDDPALRTLDGEASEVLLCDHVLDMEGASEPLFGDVQCSRLSEHDGAHFGIDDGGGAPREVVWETGDCGDERVAGPRAVPRDSDEARAAFEREDMHRGGES